jgi:FAD/FMN-containing dehydrogenase
MPQYPAPLLHLIEQVQHAAQHQTPLNICGGNSKAFYGGLPRGSVLDMRPLSGIVSYEPTELVVTARTGTPLLELEAELAAHGQCLAFEPPRFHSASTVGGMVAAGLSGPARSQVGSVRDFVLGATLINGRGELLTFGGQVMKNVAGYDVSRLMVGAMGILGVLCEVSLKVLPRPPASQTVQLACSEEEALQWLQRWRSQPYPLHASVWCNGVLWVRLSGAASAVRATVDSFTQTLGAAPVPESTAATWWDAVRDQTHVFFQDAEAKQTQGWHLWRVSLPAPAPAHFLPEPVLIEWGGALRWYWSQEDASNLRAKAQQLGGHATLYRSADRTIERLTPLAAPLWQIHQRMKAAFDPAGILNPGRLYRDL